VKYVRNDCSNFMRLSGEIEDEIGIKMK